MKTTISQSIALALVATTSYVLAAPIEPEGGWLPCPDNQLKNCLPDPFIKARDGPSWIPKMVEEVNELEEAAAEKRNNWLPHVEEMPKEAVGTLDSGGKWIYNEVDKLTGDKRDALETRAAEGPIDDVKNHWIPKMTEETEGTADYVANHWLPHAVGEVEGSLPE